MLISLMVRQGSPELAEGLTTNEINLKPFVLSLSKDLIRIFLKVSLQKGAEMQRYIPAIFSSLFSLRGQQ